VDEERGAVSLRLQGIQQGTDRTAAELALVRLRQELSAAELAQFNIEAEIRGCKSRMNNAPLLSTADIAAKRAAIRALRSSIPMMKLATKLRAIVTPLMVIFILWFFWMGSDRVPNGTILEIWWPFLACVAIAIIGMFAYWAIVDPNATSILRNLEGELLTHEANLKIHQTEEENIRALSAELPSAKGEVDRIESEIVRNRSIVRV
jgi:hypothetical protein